MTFNNVNAKVLKKKVHIIWCFSWSDVDTDDKGLTLTSNTSHAQTGSARVPVCVSGEKNCVVNHTGRLQIDYNALQASKKENLDKLPETNTN